MPQVCKTCAHPNREEIDRQLVTPRSKRSIAHQFGLTEAGVRRHVLRHLAAELLSARTTADQNHFADLLTRIEKMTVECESIVELAKERGDYNLVLKAINQLRHVSGLLAQVAGVVQTGSKTLVLQQNVTMAAEEDHVHQVVEDVVHFQALLQSMATAGALPAPQPTTYLPPETVEDAEIVEFPRSE